FWLPRWLPTPGKLRFDRAVRRLDEIIYRLIRQRRQTGEPGHVRAGEPGRVSAGEPGCVSAGRGDLLSVLLHARAEDDGTRMADTQVRDEAMTLFPAGHETTALTLSGAWSLLALNPPAAERLAAEVDAVLSGRPPNADDLPRLCYTEQVVQEVMRVRPPIYTI